MMHIKCQKVSVTGEANTELYDKRTLLSGRTVCQTRRRERQQYFHKKYIDIYIIIIFNVLYKNSNYN